MFAVIRSGGKQYKVDKDDVLVLERLPGEAGSTVTLPDVLMLGGDVPKAGTPLVAGASVSAEIVRQQRADKVVAFKKKRRKNTHRKRGHRQHQTVVRITAINAG